MTRHPATEGNELRPSDVIIPDPSGGDGRLSVRNDLAAEFAGLSISSTEPTDMPNGGVWVNLSAEPTGIDRIQTYDESTDAFIPISANDTVVSEEEPEPEMGLLWFEPVDDGANLYAANSDRWEFLQFIPAIPDVVVSRLEDNATSSRDVKSGIAFSSETEFSVMGFKISANTEDATRAELFEVFDGEAELVATKDISDLGPGDEFSMEADIKTSPDYNISLDAEGDDYSAGRGDADYPHTEGDLSIIGRFQTDPSEIDDDGSPYNIVSVGDLGFD